MPTLIFPHISHREAYIDMLGEWKNTPEFTSGHVSPGALFRGENFEEFLSLAKADLTKNH